MNIRMRKPAARTASGSMSQYETAIALSIANHNRK
jgi:hypothetical protein